MSKRIRLYRDGENTVIELEGRLRTLSPDANGVVEVDLFEKGSDTAFVTLEIRDEFAFPPAKASRAEVTVTMPRAEDNA